MRRRSLLLLIIALSVSGCFGPRTYPDYMFRWRSGFDITRVELSDGSAVEFGAQYGHYVDSTKEVIGRVSTGEFKHVKRASIKSVTVASDPTNAMTGTILWTVLGLFVAVAIALFLNPVRFG